MRCPGGVLGDGEAVLPRRRDRAQDELRQQVRGPEVPPARTIPLHADHGRSHQELRGQSDQPGLVVERNKFPESSFVPFQKYKILNRGLI